MGIAAAASIFTFPSIISHLFLSGHSQDARAGLSSISDYVSRIAVCFNTINNMLFGRFLYLLIPATVVMCILQKKKNEKNVYLFILLPAFLYFVLIAITASWTNERYFTPIFAILYCGILTLFFTKLSEAVKDQKTFSVAALVFILLLTALSYYKAEWPYLYRDDLEYLNKAEEHKDAECICIHNEYRLAWEVQLNFNEFMKYKSFTLLDQRKIKTEDLKNYIGSDQVVIHLTCVDNKEEYLKEIIEALPQFSAYEVIGGNGNGVSYYLY
jgi:hypothetical protein